MPYAPGVQFDPGLISRIGDSISGSIMSVGNTLAQQKKEAKAAQAIFDALEPEPDPITGETKPHPLGLNKDQFKSKSWSDQSAIIQGAIKAHVLKQDAAEKQQRAQHMALLIDALKSQQGAQADIPKFISAFANAPGRTAPGLDDATGGNTDLTGESSTTPPGIEDRLAAAIAAGPRAATASGNTMGSQMLERIIAESSRAKGEKNFMPVEYNVGGRKGIVSPITGSLHPDTVPGTQLDDRIKLMDRKGKIDLRNRLASSLHSFMLPDQAAAIQSQLAALNADLGADSGGSGGDAPSPAAPASQANITQEAYGKLKSGDLYWWNGKQYPKK